MQTCIDGGGHEDDLAVVGVADWVAVDALEQEKQEVDVALVHLVEHDVRVALERRLRFAMDELLEQRARRAAASASGPPTSPGPPGSPPGCLRNTST